MRAIRILCLAFVVAFLQCGAVIVVRGPVSAPSAGGPVQFDSVFEKGIATTATPFSFACNAGTITGSVGNHTNRVLVGIIGFYGTAASVGTVTMHWDSTGTNQSMTAVTGASGDASPGSIYMFYLIAPTISSTGTLRADWTGGYNNVCYMGAVSLYDANQSTGVQNGRTDTATSTSVSSTVTSASNNMIVAGFFDNNSTSTTYTSGTSRWDERGFNGNMSASTKLSTTGSTVISATLGSSVIWRQVAVDVIHL